MGIVTPTQVNRSHFKALLNLRYKPTDILEPINTKLGEEGNLCEDRKLYVYVQTHNSMSM